MRLVALACLAAFLLAACGTRGALYLPPPEGAEDPQAKQKRR